MKDLHLCFILLAIFLIYNYRCNCEGFDLNATNHYTKGVIDACQADISTCTPACKTAITALQSTCGTYYTSVPDNIKTKMDACIASSGGDTPGGGSSGGDTPGGGSSNVSPKLKDVLPIKGHYLWSWTRHATDPPKTGPPGSNIGITFPGAKASGQNGAWLEALANPPQTNNRINLLSIGGGAGADGQQSFNPEDIRRTIELIPTIKRLGYDGICFDLESGNATISEYKDVFTKTKQADMIVMATTSYFATSESHGGLGAIINELVQTVLTNPTYVDILSPQIYANNCDDSATWPVNGGGDFNGNGPTDATREAYRNCEFLAPSINSSDWSSIKPKWTSLGLPEPIGYFQYCNKYV